MNQRATNEKGKSLNPVRGVLLACALFVGILIATELLLRAIGFDFEDPTRALSKYPVYYRVPTVPTGAAYFRRPGPQRWEGQVLLTQLRAEGGTDDAYGDERPILVAYDEHGFRNPKNLTDWEIVVVGDSFTEAGYLADEDLFTELLGEQLNVRVRNLGVSYTGTRTHISYLQQFGKAASTKHAVLAFFEGNDLHEMLREARREMLYRDGKLDHKNLLEYRKKQSSILVATLRVFRRPPEKEPGLLRNAFFLTNAGKTPVSLLYTPVQPAEAPDLINQILPISMRDWAEAAREMGMKPWLVFLPCKHRVLHGHLEYDPSAEERFAAWQPSDWTTEIRSLCEEFDIAFIDATRTLREETNAGRLTYNTVYDTHLNKLGSQCVARLLTDAMRAELAANAGDDVPPAIIGTNLP